MDISALHVRQAHSTGNAHLAAGDGTLICGSQAKASPVPVRSPQGYVTCAKCRRAAGWVTIPGSFAARSGRALDSSAWGINRGR